jgi:hypothetical protein
MITQSAKPAKARAANHPETQRHTWSVGRINYTNTLDTGESIYGSNNKKIQVQTYRQEAFEPSLKWK